MAVEWGRANSVGGLLYVLGESLYRTGHIEESKEYFLKAYYGFLIMKRLKKADAMKDTLQEYFSLEV